MLLRNISQYYSIKFNVQHQVNINCEIAVLHKLHYFNLNKWPKQNHQKLAAEHSLSVTWELLCTTLALHTLTLAIHTLTLARHTLTLAIHTLTLVLHTITLALHTSHSGHTNLTLALPTTHTGPTHHSLWPYVQGAGWRHVVGCCPRCCHPQDTGLQDTRLLGTVY